MFGDFEAQRHWMEVALNVPIRDWYTDTPDNELLYWGLDYPPLSGYVSWIFGKLVGYVEPEAVRLYSSRGFESPGSRAAMRFTALVGDILIFFPGLFLVCGALARSLSGTPGSGRKEPVTRCAKVLAFCSTLPAIILIDHGHFQYNGISLGLFLISMWCFFEKREAVGAAFFCLSIYFKQMGLYYGLAVFSYLISRMTRILRAHGLSSAMWFATKILTAISATTAACFAPWALESVKMTHILHRLFPVGRGLYEDKVANVWCSISIILKLHEYMEQRILFGFCAAITCLASVPFVVAVAMRPSRLRLLLAVAGCSLAAYLFSYQVHEKQVLLPLLPISLLVGHYPIVACWASQVATFSLFPLLLREHLIIPYFCTWAIHLAIFWNAWQHELSRLKGLVRLFALVSAFVGLVLNVLLVVRTPPHALPDILVLLNTIYSCAHLCLLYLVLTYIVWTEQGLQRRREKSLKLL